MYQSALDSFRGRLEVTRSRSPVKRPVLRVTVRSPDYPIDVWLSKRHSREAWTPARSTTGAVTGYAGHDTIAPKPRQRYCSGMRLYTAFRERPA